MGSAGGQGAAPGRGQVPGRGQETGRRKQPGPSRPTPAARPRPEARSEAGAQEKGTRWNPELPPTKPDGDRHGGAEPGPTAASAPPGLSQAARPQSSTWPDTIPACPAAWGICRIISPSSASLFPNPGPSLPTLRRDDAAGRRREHQCRAAPTAASRPCGAGDTRGDKTDRLEGIPSPLAFQFRPPPETERTEEIGLLLLTSDLQQCPCWK